ncbi:MAG TPA: hypothetical protein VG028_00935 [Terriglobia bacterium]|nr:hypothetical protein [Terriglobia bacterium]
MLSTPTVLGISMAPRNNRRLLVAATYSTLLALMAAAIIILPSGRQIDAIWMCFVVGYHVVSRAIFGRLVKDTVFPQLREGGMTSLGLAPRSHRSDDEPDEREVAVRNAAYFKAYRALAMYSIAICAASPLLFSLRGSIAVRVLLVLTMPLWVMAWTLPQAVVLWTEPDVPEEARV